MKSQQRRHDLPSLPENDKVAVSKRRPASRAADGSSTTASTSGKKSDKSLSDDRSASDKKSRRPLLKCRSDPVDENSSIETFSAVQPFFSNESDVDDDKNPPCATGKKSRNTSSSQGRRRISLNESESATINQKDSVADLPYSLGRLGPSLSVSAATSYTQRSPEDPLVEDGVRKIRRASSFQQHSNESHGNKNKQTSSTMNSLETAANGSGSRHGSMGLSEAIKNTSLFNFDENNTSDKKRNSPLKEASDLVKKPQRVLPDELREKFTKRNKKAETKTETTPEKELAPVEDTMAIEQVPLQNNDLSDSSQVPVISKSRRQWKSSLCYTIAGLRFLSLYEELRAKGMNIQRAKALEADGLSVLLSAANVSRGDPTISAKIEDLTRKIDRSDEDIEALERILSIKNRAFGRFSLDQRLKFCKIVQYQHYKGERMIVKEGHVSWAFYFILSGQVEIFKVKDNLKYRLNVIGAGGSFGDRTMNMLNDKRTASVASTMDVELLKIDKTDFFDITNVRDEKGIASRSAKILQIPHFSAAPGGFVERIAPFAQVITYEPNEYILHEGVENNKIFWLVKGTCQSIKMLPFVKRVVNESYAGKTVQVVPFVVGKTKLEEGDEFFYEFATTHEVEIGSNFPDLPVPTGGSITDHVFYVNKKDYLEQLKNEDPADLSSKAAVSIVAKTKVEVICVNRVDYVGLAVNDMILSIINSKDMYRIPISMLQDSYLQARKWNSYKKKVVADVVSKEKRK